MIVSWEFTAPLSEGEISHFLEEVLRIQREAAAGRLSRLRAANIAATAVSEIVRGLMTPFLEDLKLRIPSEEYLNLPANQRRSHIARPIDLGLPILQPEAAAELLDALQRANANEIASLFGDTIDRRLANRELRAQADLGLLVWVAWRRGWGETEKKAIETIANASGWEINSLRDWKNSVKRVFGAEHVEAQLALAREIGCLEAQGPTLKGLRPREVGPSSEALGGLA